jgi:hypothetical protein
MNRKLLVVTGLVFLFVIVALVWYFFYAQPVLSPSLGKTNDPLLKNQLPPRYQFMGNRAGGDNQTSVTEVTQKPEDPLIRVWDRPSTGQTFITDQILREETGTTTGGTTTIETKRMVRATTTILLFVDRGTGYVYGYSPDDNSIFQITNTVLPGIHDAYIFNDGKRIIMRYYENGGDNTFTVGVIANIPPFSKGGTPSALVGVEYLNSEVSSVSVNNESGTASYVVKTDSGSSVYSVKDEGPTLVASSPFGEWVLNYGGNSLYATTKASSFAMGVTTILPTFNIVVGERPGLIVQPSPSHLIGSSWSKGELLTFLIGNSGSRELSIKTLSSKCGWGQGEFLLCAVPKTLSKGGRDLPDAWFQGLTSFEDDLIYVDTNSLTESSFFNFDKKYGVFDITNITISKENDFISFLNKKNGELWMLKSKLIAHH